MQHGEVISTTYEDGVVYCDVQPTRTSGIYPEVPVLRPHSGFIQLPEEGDVVSLEKLRDGSRFISSVMANQNSHPENMKEGELTMMLNGGAQISFLKEADNTYNLHIDSGDAGNVFIDGIDFDEHVHYYDWSDPGGSSLTDPPESENEHTH